MRIKRSKIALLAAVMMVGWQTRAEMVLIPAGSFIMGATTNMGHESYSDEIPQHTVSVSAFYLEKTEVTKAQWDEVYSWATSHGYSFDNAGSGKASAHPVHTVNWYDSVKWCNARSEKEGLTPCYYTTFAQSTVYRTGVNDISSDCVKWGANGYRLPTEAEWEKAARGGSAGHRFPWTDADTITHSRANYSSSSGYAYDVSPTRGYHPDYDDGGTPYTSPVGSFAANGYDLYDMAGNVCEWCWDWYDAGWYSNAGATQSDTHGPTTSTNRVIRGGGWVYYAYLCRAADRFYSGSPVYMCDYIGFRCAQGIGGGPAGTLQFSASSASVNENAGSVSLTVTRSGGSSGAASVNYATANGTASAGTDYTATNGTLNWADGNTNSQTITVPIINRSGIQGSRTFTATLSTASGASLGSPTTNTVTINDVGSAGTLQFSASSASVNENAGSVTLTVTRSGGSSGAASVHYATANGTASSNTDYTATSGDFTWTDGNSDTQTITVPIINDSIQEDNETFSVTLSNVSGASLGSPSSATVTILANDDPAGTLQFTASSASVNENAGSVSLTVTRSGGSSGAASVDYATANDTASAGTDYTAVSGTLNWADGNTNSQTITVPIIDRSGTQGSRTFTVNLSSASGTSLGSPESVTVTINDGGVVIGDFIVIDVSGGPSASSYPVSYLSAVPSNGWTEEYKTTKIVLRKIPAGTFTMGSPEGELGRDSDETQHQVTLTKDFYIGVFEVTQKQWERVMGNWPSYFNNATYRDSRPVEQVSYYDIRENPANSWIDPHWPQSSQVHADSFMGKLRTKTGLTALDLPTEAQWEYACRAGTTTALNSGYNLTNQSADVRMDAVGRCLYNGGSAYSSGCGPSAGSATAGSYLANQWGLFDMHGNVREWCLDWYDTYPGAVSDPVGAASGSVRVSRGGSWESFAWSCRSANRNYFYSPSARDYIFGFRLTRTLEGTSPNPGTLQFSASSASVNENAGSITLAVTRSGGSSGAATVYYATANGTASAGTDYTATSGDFTWTDGNSDTKTIMVPIINRAGTQGNRAFFVNLSSASGASLGSPPSVTVTINDVTTGGSGTIQFSASRMSVSENAGVCLLLYATRSNGNYGAASVHYATANGTASAGTDYTATSGTLNWDDGNSDTKLIEVEIIDDSIPDGNKSFTVTLANASGAILGSPSSATVTIVDNDSSIRGLYVDHFQEIVTSATKTTELLQYAKDNHFNYLCLYGVQDVLRWGQSQQLSNFVSIAKSSYGISQIGVALGAGDESYCDKLAAFNIPAKIDVLNLEYEFWNATAAERASEFSVYTSMLQHMRALADQHDMLVETYIGWPNQQECAILAPLLDRILIHAYVTDPNDAYNYFIAQNRVSALAAGRTSPLVVFPIFSTAPNENGESMWLWLKNHSMDEAETVFRDDYVSADASWKGNIILSGYQYFCYSWMPNISACIPMIEEISSSPVQYTADHGDNICVKVSMNPCIYYGVEVDWWVVALAGSSWYYLNNSLQWTPFDGNLSNCYPVYQGALFNLPPLQVLNMTGLPPGTYTFWFAVDYPMDGVLDVNGICVSDSVSIIVQ